MKLRKNMIAVLLKLKKEKYVTGETLFRNIAYGMYAEGCQASQLPGTSHPQRACA